MSLHDYLEKRRMEFSAIYNNLRPHDDIERNAARNLMALYARFLEKARNGEDEKILAIVSDFVERKGNSLDPVTVVYTDIKEHIESGGLKHTMPDSAVCLDRVPDAEFRFLKRESRC